MTQNNLNCKLLINDEFTLTSGDGAFITDLNSIKSINLKNSSENDIHFILMELE